MSRQNRARKLINLYIKKEISSKRESGKSVGGLSAGYFYTYVFSFCIIFFLFKWLCWMVPLL
jgi:hypothetical protein